MFGQLHLIIPNSLGADTGAETTTLESISATRWCTNNSTNIIPNSLANISTTTTSTTTTGEILDAIFEVGVMVLFGEVKVGGIVGGYGIGSAVGADGTAGGAILPAPHARPWKILLTQPVKVETAISQKIKGQLRR